MIKNILFLGVILFNITQLSSQIITSPYEPGSKSLKQFQQEYKFIQSKKIHHIQIFECQDSNCNINETQLIFSKEYDTLGRLTREICFNCETDSMKTLYTYNQLNLPETVTDFQFPEYPDTSIFEYNSTGKLINENYGSGESRKYRFTYTPSGLIQKKIGQSYAPDSIGTFAWSDCETRYFTYDKSDKLIEIKWMYVPGWGIPFKQKFTYNQNNQLVMYTQFSIGDTEKTWNFQHTIEYRYNNNGLITREIKNSNENEKTYISYRYIFY